MRDHISVSQVKLYLACPLKYRFVYIDEIPRPFKPSGLAFGSAVHSAIEWLHKQRIAGKIPGLDNILRIFSADWQAQKVDDIRFKDGESDTKLLEKGKELLTVYFKNNDKTKPKVAEFPFKVPLYNIDTADKLDLPLEGVIDLIEEDDTLVEIKTSARTLDDLALLDHIQLTAYSYAYILLYRKTPKLRLDNLIKTKKARLEQSWVKRERQDYLRLFHIAGEVIKGIRSGYFCPNPGWMCQGCEYLENCKKWRG